MGILKIFGNGNIQNLVATKFEIKIALVSQFLSVICQLVANFR